MLTVANYGCLLLETLLFIEHTSLCTAALIRQPFLNKQVVFLYKNVVDARWQDGGMRMQNSGPVLGNLVKLSYTTQWKPE